ncbi:MAG: 30S ribosomal protein S16 [Puniceicoccales bacterium]|jgi:small subunit ribosomal protein S16|nr:30S ribosomal protein S16 [Puniceicoccales bacterium]
MALKIRLQRQGNRNRPVYRIVVAESTSRRDGRYVEALGNYDPRARGNAKEFTFNLDRASYWMSVGAKPTETVRSIVKRARASVSAQN